MAFMAKDLMQDTPKRFPFLWGKKNHNKNLVQFSKANHLEIFRKNFLAPICMGMKFYLLNHISQAIFVKQRPL